MNKGVADIQRELDGMERKREEKHEANVKRVNATFDNFMLKMKDVVELLTQANEPPKGENNG